MTWEDAVFAVEKVTQMRGGIIHDFTTGKDLDAGQAVCRELYGENWMNEPEYYMDNDSATPPLGFIAAAKRVREGTPEWMRETREFPVMP